MKVVYFTHSILSDWNHGNAHFLRGVIGELRRRGHEVVVYEPVDAWSVDNLVRDHGTAPFDALARVYPSLPVVRYAPAHLDAARATDGADLVLVHEWNAPEVVAALGRARARGGFRLLFHDTHHRAVSAPHEMARYDLAHYDGALVFGEALRDVYLARGWVARAWTWHEAADVRVFRPRAGVPTEGDLVWVGNWGDGERTEELHALLLEPARALRLRTTVHGVRYPPEALAALRAAGAAYRGWLPNFEVPRAFAAHRVTVHVPRRWYVERLPGIPTIRPFEALACGVPLVTGPWEDVEGLFRVGVDYLRARDGREMRRLLREVLEDASLAASLAAQGRARVLARHTCAHRVDELMAVARTLGVRDRPRTPREETTA